MAKKTKPPVHVQATKTGDTCWTMEGYEHVLRIGDLVENDNRPGIVWRVVGETKVKRQVCEDDSWYLLLQPIFSFLVNNNTDKDLRVSWFDVYHRVRPIDLVTLATYYSKLELVIADEARRLSK